MEMQARFDRLSAALKKTGLRILHSAPGELPQGSGSVLVIGHAGSEFWPFFQDSPERHDGQRDPLDRWSRRVISAAAPQMTFVSPNDGLPYPPIHQLTKGSALHPSPLGMLVHSTFGLWTAVRGLLISHGDTGGMAATQTPCATCEKPCLSACPVGAFTGQGYDAAACASHLRANPRAVCWRGCLARKACPVAPMHAYRGEHAKFYMDAFTTAMAERPS